MSQPQQPPIMPPAPQWQPPQPKKSSIGKKIGIGIAAGFGGLFMLGACAAVMGSSETGSGGSTSAAVADTSAPAKDAKADDAKAETKPEPKKASGPKKVTFKIWGSAPNGVDVNYGSDSDSRSGSFKNGKFEATLPLKKDAMFFNVMGQLQGGGDINCSVTVDGHTKKGHAQGDYNICDAQVNAGLLGGWD